MYQPIHHYYKNTNPRSTEMRTSLVQLKHQEYEVMQGLVDSLWDEDSGENLTLTSLQEQIQAKTEAFISVTKKDGLFDQEISQVKKAMESAKSFIEKIEKKREYIKSVIYGLASNAPDGFLAFSNGISKEYVKPQMGERRSIKKEAIIDPKYKSFTLPNFNNDEFTTIVASINYYAKHSGNKIEEGLIDKIGDVKTSCNVTDLPDTHTAIETKLTPGFKIVKNRPKPEIK